MTTVASQITSLTVVYSTVYSDTDQRKHQSPASLAFVRGIHRDRWIPRTKGQLCGKCFHLMTSSWPLLHRYLPMISQTDIKLKWNLIQWGRMMHIYVSELDHLGSGQDLTSNRRQPIAWTNDEILTMSTWRKWTRKCRRHNGDHLLWPQCIELNFYLSSCNWLVICNMASPWCMLSLLEGFMKRLGYNHQSRCPYINLFWC